MIENWAETGMPPNKYKVVKRETITNPETKAETQYVWLEGEHPHMGTVLIDGDVTETFVEIYLFPGSKPKIKKDYTQKLPDDHPLHNWQLRNQQDEIKEIPIVKEEAI